MSDHHCLSGAGYRQQDQDGYADAEIRQDRPEYCLQEYQSIIELS